MSPVPFYETTETIHFFLLPGFSMMGFVCALEPLRVANRFRPGVYQWVIVSADGKPVQASDGISILVDKSIMEIDKVECIFIVAGFRPLDHQTPAINYWLQRINRQGAILGAVDSGAFNLAEAGLLEADQVTLHWEAIPAFMERYPHLRVRQELFEMGDRRMTCAGGTAALDMMHEFISRRFGSEFAIQVSEQFVRGNVRNQSDQQRMQIAGRYNVHNKKVVHAIHMMESNTENPWSTNELAASMGITRRHLERLFRIYLNETPTNFYLQLRLERARQLLQQTEMTIMEISVACGFESSSYFSRAYRLRFGQSPSKDREKSG